VRRRAAFPPLADDPGAMIVTARNAAEYASS